MTLEELYTAHNRESATVDQLKRDIAVALIDEPDNALAAILETSTRQMIASLAIMRTTADEIDERNAE